MLGVIGHFLPKMTANGPPEVEVLLNVATAFSLLIDLRGMRHQKFFPSFREDPSQNQIAIV